MGRYTVSLEEYLDHILRNAHVHFAFDVLVRYGVVVVVCADMVVIYCTVAIFQVASSYGRGGRGSRNIFSSENAAALLPSFF